MVSMQQTMRNCVYLLALLLFAAPKLCAAGQDVQIESSQAVKSPDGLYTVIVDRLMPVVDGSPERYSGRMVVRISAGDTSAPVRQRFIEATQVRFLDQPIWLENSKWCAFVYNVAKNAFGLVYMLSLIHI